MHTETLFEQNGRRFPDEGRATASYGPAIAIEGDGRLVRANLASLGPRQSGGIATRVSTPPEWSVRGSDSVPLIWRCPSMSPLQRAWDRNRNCQQTGEGTEAYSYHVAEAHAELRAELQFSISLIWRVPKPAGGKVFPRALANPICNHSEAFCLS